MSLYSKNLGGLRLLVADATTALSFVWTTLGFFIRNYDMYDTIVGVDYEPMIRVVEFSKFDHASIALF